MTGVAGAGVPVVLLPAEGPTAEVTVLAARLRAAGHRAFVLDTPPGTGAVARQHRAGRALAALDDGFALVGWGAGSPTAQFVASVRRVSALVLVGGALPPVELGLDAPPAGLPLRVQDAGPVDVEAVLALLAAV